MTAPPSTGKQLRSLFFGGILPVIAFTLIENSYGTVAGLIAGMVFGVGEVLYEWRTQGQVNTMTWIGNGMILVLGGVSLVTQEGIWFKLQPAILEAAFGGILVGSVLLKRPFLVGMMEKQGQLAVLDPRVRPAFVEHLSGMTFRLSIFLFFHAGLATWAAIHWSTAAWAVLKGVGFTGSMVVYVVVESFILRYRIRQLK